MHTNTVELYYGLIDLKEASACHTKEMAAIALTENQNLLELRWIVHGEYTASSIYKLMVSQGRTRWGYDEIWKGRAPSKVKIFTYLLLQERIMTRDVLERRVNCQLHCVLYNSGVRETAFHLMYECSCARRVWTTIANKWGVAIFEPGALVSVPVLIEKIWVLGWQGFRGRTNMSKG